MVFSLCYLCFEIYRLDHEGEVAEEDSDGEIREHPHGRLGNGSRDRHVRAEEHLENSDDNLDPSLLII